ncbi:MAG: diguanylate cyclase [Dinoroseobacter sp.]|nr:diguanylate cyclase [Dinoroseobacter sp.]
MSGTILVIDDVATNRIVMKVKLASACYSVLLAETGREGLQIAREEQPDLILLDVVMPEMDGFSVCKRLKADPVTSSIPVIMITSLDDTDTRLRGLASGADEFLSKPLSEVTLLARVRSLLRSHSKAAELIAQTRTPELGGFVEERAKYDPPRADCVSLILAPDGVGSNWANGLRRRIREDVRILSRTEALEASKDQAQVFVIEADSARPDEGIDILSELRSRPATQHAGQIFVVREGEAALAARALDMGADEVVYAPVSIDEMALRLRAQMQRKQDEDRMRDEMSERLRLAVIDPLTGLYNRRFGMSQLGSLAGESIREARDFAVLLLDFDFFKSVNDHYGHAAGDQVLRETAAGVRRHLRSLDIVARIGGEEFMIVLPDTDLSTATQVAERLRRRIEDTAVVLPGADQTEIRVTISIGLATGGREAPNQTVPEILERADRALYEAKAEGRNQVVVSNNRSAA